MLTWLTVASVRFRYLVVALAAGLMVVAVAKLPDMSVNVLPETAPVVVEVQTEALGLSAPEVESLVTVPLEKNLLEGVLGVTDVTSDSIPGLVRHRPALRVGDKPLPGSSARAGAAHLCLHPAERVQAASHAAARFVLGRRHGDRPDVQHAQPGRAIRAVALDYRPAAARSVRGGQRLAPSDRRIFSSRYSSTRRSWLLIIWRSMTSSTRSATLSSSRR